MYKISIAISVNLALRPIPNLISGCGSADRRLIVYTNSISDESKLVRDAFLFEPAFFTVVGASGDGNSDVNRLELNFHQGSMVTGTEKESQDSDIRLDS